MNLVSCDQTYRLCRKAYLQEWFVVRIREGLGERRGCHGNSTMHNIVKQGNDLVSFKSELRPGENFFIFRQDAGIKGEGEFAG